MSGHIPKHAHTFLTRVHAGGHVTFHEHMGRKALSRPVLLQPYLSVGTARKHLSEPAVRNNLRPLRTPVGLTPALPHSPRRWGAGGEGSELRRYECSHTCSGLSCCVSRQNVGPGGRVGGGGIHEGLRRSKREAEAPACLSRKSGSCHFGVYHTVFLDYFFFLHELQPNNSCRAAGRRGCFLSIMHQKRKKKEVSFLFQSLTFKSALCYSE